MATSVATEISSVIALVALRVGRISGSLILILPISAVAPSKGRRSVFKPRVICWGVIRLVFKGRAELFRLLARGSHIPLPFPLGI